MSFKLSFESVQNFSSSGNYVLVCTQPYHLFRYFFYLNINFALCNILTPENRELLKGSQPIFSVESATITCTANDKGGVS